MAHFYLLAYNEKLLGTETGFIRLSEVEISEHQVEECFTVGRLKGDDYSLCILRELKSEFDLEKCVGLRSLLAKVGSEEEYNLLSRAAQIAIWYASFVFCPRCATELTCHSTELAKVCGNCHHHQYPRISPCIIVLVRKGDKCLLAHASRFSTGRYSTLAGFIEAGESAENAVAREIMEEVGVEVENIRYCFSQSWSFPHSLMLGYFADYKSGTIVPDGEEIILADWFDQNNLPVLPPNFTIARRLINKFFNEMGVNLSEEKNVFFDQGSIDITKK